MEITGLLTKQLTMGTSFRAGICSIDIIESSKLRGSPEDKHKTRNALKDLIESLFGDHPIAIQSWSGDGGILLQDAANGFEPLIEVVDRLINLLPLFNRSRGRLNYLPTDEIHLRVVCHAGDIQNTGAPDTLPSDQLNDLVKREREVGVRDHVVVTGDIYRQLAPYLQRRFVSSKEIHPQLGNCYVLEQNVAPILLQIEEHKSDEVRDWIIRSTRTEDYDLLDVFSYSNETLFKFVGVLPRVRTRVLARNWMIEAGEEAAFNEELAQERSVMRNPWVKAENIKSMAQFLNRHELELRFYDTRPVLKGAILSNSRTGKRSARIGFYSWVPDREEGGSPYVGDRWSALELSDDGGAQTLILDAITSFFEELWTKGEDYQSLIEHENERTSALLQMQSVEKIWEIDRQKKPYLIVVPGRSLENRPYPSVASEDLGALRGIEELLKQVGAKVEIEIMQDPSLSSERITNWSGHLVHICRRTLDVEVHDYLEKQNFPYQLRAESKEPEFVHKRHNLLFTTPKDYGKSELWDYCVVGKCDRPNGTGKLFIISGLHAMGTWGGGFYLSRPEHLQKLANTVDRNNFAVIIKCEYEVPPRVVSATNIMEPETFSRQIPPPSEEPSARAAHAGHSTVSEKTS